MSEFDEGNLVYHLRDLAEGCHDGGDLDVTLRHAADELEQIEVACVVCGTKCRDMLGEDKCCACETDQANERIRQLEKNNAYLCRRIISMTDNPQAEISRVGLSDMHCRSCRFWDNSRYTSDTDAGHCRRHAPALKTEDNCWENFPFTRSADWCGDHEEKKTCGRS